MYTGKKLVLSIALAVIGLTHPIKPMEKDYNSEEENLDTYTINSLGGLPSELKLLIQLQAISSFVNEGSLGEATTTFNSFMAHFPLRFASTDFYLLINNAKKQIDFYFMDLLIKKIKKLTAHDQNFLMMEAIEHKNSLLINILNLFKTLDEWQEEFLPTRIDRMIKNPEYIHPLFFRKLLEIKLNNPGRLQSFRSLELPPISHELNVTIKQIMDNDDVALLTDTIANLDSANTEAFGSYLALGLLGTPSAHKVFEHYISHPIIRDNIAMFVLFILMFNFKKKLKMLLPFCSINDPIAEHGTTTLMSAIFFYQNDSRIIRLLINKGADVNIQDHGGNTALHIACSHNFKDAVPILLNNGADPNIQNNLGLTPLMFLIRFIDLTIVELLLQENSKTDINLQDKNRLTALHSACAINNKKAVQILLKKGANPNLKDIFGNTALHIAVIINEIELAKLLLKGGATVNVINNEYISPLVIAQVNGNSPLESLLKNYLPN